MRKLFLHIKRLVTKFWYFILFSFAISPLFALLVILVMTVLSLLFFEDPIDEGLIRRSFTDDELRILMLTDVDEKVDADEYFALRARFDELTCQGKIGRYTTVVGVEVTKDSYICLNDVDDTKKGFEPINEIGTKYQVLSRIKGTPSVNWLTYYNRNLVFRYRYVSSGKEVEIVITPEEMKKL